MKRICERRAYCSVQVEFKPDDRVRQTSTGEEGIILHHPYDDEKGWLTDIGEANARFVQEADLAPARHCVLYHTQPCVIYV